MNARQQFSERLSISLDLPTPPITVGFSDSPPAGIPAWDGLAPAGCSFWQQAATSCFTTASNDHELCAIGVHTHNLSGTADSQAVELGDSLKAMMGLDYVREEEVAGIPTMAKASSYVTYGPLHSLADDINFDLVLIFADARQGLILSESVARVDQSMPIAMGRPACAVIPMAINQSAATMSLGCCGARAYLDQFADGIALWALPGSKLSEYCDAVDALAGANNTLTQFHGKRAEAVAAGGRPSVKESLDALS